MAENKAHSLEVPLPAKPTTKPGDDPWKTDRSTWVHVSVPAENIDGGIHPSISLNKYTFEAGKTYLVPQLVADYVNDRLQVYAKSCIRLYRPNLDTDAQLRVAVGSTNAARINAQPVAGNAIHDGAQTPDGVVYTVS